MTAAETVGKAITVMQTFYTNAAAALLQQRRQAPEVKVGEIPPPPATWEAPYTGKQTESKGIVAILTLVKDDIEKDRAAAKTAEDKAQTDYDTFKTESEDEIGTLNTSISELEGTVADKEGDITTAKKAPSLHSHGGVNFFEKCAHSKEWS